MPHVVMGAMQLMRGWGIVVLKRAMLERKGLGGLLGGPQRGVLLLPKLEPIRFISAQSTAPISIAVHAAIPCIPPCASSLYGTNYDGLLAASP